MPYTYFPDACGGTEVYVRGLAHELAEHGYLSAVAAPADTPSEYVNDGIVVYRFATDRRPLIELAYGVPDEVAAGGFRAILHRLRPHIVHLHARTAAVSVRLIDAAHDVGASVVFTYHTPTASCVRGTMMLFGKQPCDGVIKRKRCTTCALAALGLPKPLAHLAAAVPGALGACAAAFAGGGKVLSPLRIPGLIATNGRNFRDFIGKVDHVIAVSQWVKRVLERNGVPAQKITLSRQGMSQSASWPEPSVMHARSGPLRIGFFGRIDRTKGPDLLGRALKMIPDANVRVDIYAICQFAGASRDYDLLAAQAQQDRRLHLHPAVAPDKVIGTMAEFDLIAIPSRLLETGPLVALEAFAAGVPVLGANLGGIAELVRDGVDGVLVTPDDVVAWAATIGKLAENRNMIEMLCAGIEPPRTMDAAADEMAELYARILPRRQQ